MKLYKKIILLFLISALFVMPSCKKNENEATPKADVIASKLTIGMYSPKSYNPLDTTTVYNEQAFLLMYDSLFNITPKYEAEKNLATDITMENGGTISVIQIKPNVKFHNGKTLTSYDVKHTIEYILSNGGFYAYNVRNIKGVEVVNDYTLKLSLSYPTPNLALQLTFPIISKDSENYINGTGPYKLLSEKKGKQLDLIKFQDYHNNYNSQVNKIEINLIPDKITARSLSGSGILDIFFAAYSDEGLKTVTKSHSVKRDYLTDSYVFLKLNFENRLLSLKSIRKALLLGIDRDKITNDVYMSHAEPTALPIPSTAKIYNPACSATQKQNDAISILKECGYEDRNSDGICEYVVETDIDAQNSLPKTLEFRILVKDDPISLSLAKALEYDFKKLGIVLTIEAFSQEEYVKRYSENNYDICLTGTNAGLDMDVTAFMGNGGVFSSPVNYNFESNLSKLSATAIEELKTSTFESMFWDFYENPAHIPIVFLKNTLITNDKFKEFDDVYLNNIYYKILLGKDGKNE